jgi:hypothetical protein
MAKFYVLTEEHLKRGHRPKTPNEKRKGLVRILSLIIAVETAALIYLLAR